ncbi:DUF3558 domain-containing protein [Saccharomonospora saliphila]|uniref:DUF3558 domain-containing protein n=1 Tax=Saccharomonospora saliphila TaxID=369829 RepID=UPI000360F194|nr:DUF3558 domain-containing protein [Saccharomonospora saliphila]
MTLAQSGALGAAALVAVTALSACAGEQEPGNPVVSTPRASDGTTSLSTAPVPPVSDPLDPEAWVSTPCQALTSEDRAELALAQGRTREKAATSAMSCVWALSGDRTSLVDLSVMTENATGLNAVYEANRDAELLEETKTAGYPAVYADAIDQRDDGGCVLWVGVNDRDVLYIDVSLRYVPEAQDPCGYADRVGEAIVSNLGS